MDNDFVILKLGSTVRYHLAMISNQLAFLLPTTLAQIQQKKGVSLKSEEIIIILNIRGPLDVNTKSFYLDIFYFFRQNMDSLHHINIL